jgi:hypothetical protein
MARPKDTKNIETPEMMWKYFLDYKTWVKHNPIEIEDYVGGVGKRVIRLKPRPLTNEGFNMYLYHNDITKNSFDYFNNKDGAYENYSMVCRAIKHEIRQHQIEGGMAGIYNPSITQRLNGLVEKQETTIKEQPLFPEENK